MCIRDRHVLHLVLDFRLHIIEQQMKDIQKQLKLAGSDMEQVKPLMEEFSRIQKLRNAVARQLGNNLVK